LGKRKKSEKGFSSRGRKYTRVRGEQSQKTGRANSRKRKQSRVKKEIEYLKPKKKLTRAMTRQEQKTNAEVERKAPKKKRGRKENDIRRVKSSSRKKRTRKQTFKKCLLRQGGCALYIAA